MQTQKRADENEKNKLIEFLLTRNKEQSHHFCEQSLARRQYRAKHPTEISALKCMDGRLNLSVMANIPVGIIQPYRNIGGKFDLGWPFFGHLLTKWVKYSTSKGRDCLILVTYHWSKGSRHRGCAGFGYDVKTAKKHTLDLISDLESAFGKDHTVVYPILLGIETDDEALILESKKGILDLSKEPIMTEDELFNKIKFIFPDMKDRMVFDIIPLLAGNQIHIEEIRKLHRSLEEASHKEQILAIGRGFDWLHLPNKAIIVGPYSFELGEPITLAAKLLLENIKSKRIPANEGVVLITSALFGDEADLDYKQAKVKSNSLAQFALKVIHEKVPELEKYMKSGPLIGIVSYNTRKFQQIKNSKTNFYSF